MRTSSLRRRAGCTTSCERRAVSLSDVRVLVLDEADRMLDMGFKPQVDRILRSVPDNRQTMLFSATLDGGVAELARAYTVTPSHVRAELPAEASAARSSTRSSPSRRRTSSTASSSSSAATAGSRSSSCGRSTVRTSSPQAGAPAQHQGGRDARQPLAEPA